MAIHYTADKARNSEDISDALNYRTITKAIIRHIEDNRFALLEKLTQDVLDIVKQHPWVTYAEVEIDKLLALRYADSVSMTMSYRREPLSLTHQEVDHEDPVTGATGLIGSSLTRQLLHLK